jgi:hypothetical protein
VIEPSDDMVRAFSDADFSGCGNADWEDSHVRVGLAAVLAIVERDSPSLTLLAALAGQQRDITSMLARAGGLLVELAEASERLSARLDALGPGGAP